MIESGLSKDSPFTVIPFPLKKLMGVSYQMVFDKKYCAPILEKINCDVMIMSQLITDNERKTGAWPWSYRIRIYNVRTGKQFNSISGDNLAIEKINENLQCMIQLLMNDVVLSFHRSVSMTSVQKHLEN